VPSIDEEIIRRLSALEKEVQRLENTRHLFEILNVNQPATLTADQNDYVIGDYDLLIMEADAPRTITGFAGGVDGRVLYIIVGGGNTISIEHDSVSSVAGNRIITMTGATVDIPDLSSAQFVYFLSYWILMFVS